jgi:hypothetical protein
MRRCVFCGRWVRLAFQEEGGVVSGAARLRWGGGVTEAVRLVWLLGPAGFPKGSREKSSSGHIGKLPRPANRTPACPAPDRRLLGAGMGTPVRSSTGEWSRRRERCVHCRGTLRATVASFPVATSNTALTFLRSFAGPPGDPSPQQPSPMGPTTDPPSGGDDKHNRYACNAPNASLKSVCSRVMFSTAFCSEKLSDGSGGIVTAVSRQTIMPRTVASARTVCNLQSTVQ